MDYCKKCKVQTKSIGIPKFVKKIKHYRRLSVCRICNTNKDNISKSPEIIEINELFKPARKNYETRHVKQTGIDETWQADLYCFYRPKKNTDDPSFKIQTRNNLKSKQTISVKDNHKTLLKANKGYKYILVIICIFSKKIIAAIPLKTKKGLEVANVFLKIFEERIMLNQKLPKNLHVDEGKEFYNKDLKNILIKYNINMYSTYTNKKASIIERFNRSLGDKIKKIIYQNKSWVDELPKIIKTYNNTYHRTIKMKPSEVNISNENELLSTVYNYDITKSKPKFEINDRVRLSSFTDVYRNKLKTNWTKEIFTIIKVIKSNVNYYKLKDIDGCIYEEELQISLL
ncbi:Integrase catalytic domain-containing protein [Aphis craccivora]|uniref:Integrase catalytic domain-containing protein n=1 Tax=Aphis craccivora TaxID=307492 RepID=A0A6G0VUA4_APHCR|nr:Integrase catalytic domain-containing protein [Aphis craccivora]